MKAILVLTPAESKRLIAKAVSQHPLVKKALKTGKIVIALSTTPAYVLEEITGRKLNLGKYSCGIVLPSRLCKTDEKYMLAEVALENGRERKYDWAEGERALSIVEDMGAGDVFIKGANAIDPKGNAWSIVAQPDGGEMGVMSNYASSQGVNLITPVGLEKSVAYSLEEISKETGIDEIDYSMGMPVGLMRIPGETITELEAIRTFEKDVDAHPIGSGGVNGAKGAIILLVKGKQEKVKKIIEIVENIKGEPPIQTYPPSCSECKSSTCKWSGKDIQNLPKWIKDENKQK